MPSAGRPIEFTPALRTELLTHVAQGASVARAARNVGISLRTVQRHALEDEEFHLDLELAVETAPVDPEQLMRQAARAHWRAAAWMLERTQPDRYGKRPPNSCSPEKLQTILAQLIDVALAATSPEQREAVDWQMRLAADQALAAFRPAPRVGQRWRATAGLPSIAIRTAASPGGTSPPSASLPPDGGIMSPKMRVVTEGAPSEDATEPTGEPTRDIETPESAAASRSPRRISARHAKALHILEKTKARRARRQAARAKRKARKAA